MFQVVTQPVDRVPPIQMDVAINGANLLMEVDTGAALTLISATIYQKLWPQPNTPKLHKVSVSLRIYTGEHAVEDLGKVHAYRGVRWPGGRHHLGLVVVEGHQSHGPSQLGRDWLEKIRLNWGTLYSINHSTKSLEDALSAHKALFREELAGHSERSYGKDSCGPNGPSSFLQSLHGTIHPQRKGGSSPRQTAEGENY